MALLGLYICSSKILNYVLKVFCTSGTPEDSSSYAYASHTFPQETPHHLKLGYNVTPLLGQCVLWYSALAG